jgi:hypothetical protein
LKQRAGSGTKCGKVGKDGAMASIQVQFLSAQGSDVVEEVTINNVSYDLYTTIQSGKMTELVYHREDGADFIFIEAIPGDVDSLPVVRVRLRPN